MKVYIADTIEEIKLTAELPEASLAKYYILNYYKLLKLLNIISDENNRTIFVVQNIYLDTFQLLYEGTDFECKGGEIGLNLKCNYRIYTFTEKDACNILLNEFRIRNPWIVTDYEKPFSMNVKINESIYRICFNNANDIQILNYLNTLNFAGYDVNKNYSILISVNGEKSILSGSASIAITEDDNIEIFIKEII